VYSRLGLFLLDDTHRVDVCAIYLLHKIATLLKYAYTKYNIQ